MTRLEFAPQPSEVLAKTEQLANNHDYCETRVYTIWPANQMDLPAVTSGAWYQERRWLVLDVTDGLAAAHVVEGPVAYPEALHRAAELRVVARTKPMTSEKARARKRDV
jgi:hypothetical protein